MSLAHISLILAGISIITGAISLYLLRSGKGE
jgi:hypothetical protein